MINVAQALLAGGADDLATEVLALAVVVGGVLFALLSWPIPVGADASASPAERTPALRSPGSVNSAAGHAPATPAPRTPSVSGRSEAQRVVYHHASTRTDVEIDRLVYELRTAS